MKVFPFLYVMPNKIISQYVDDTSFTMQAKEASVENLSIFFVIMELLLALKFIGIRV